MKAQLVSFSLGAAALCNTPSPAAPVWYDSFDYSPAGTVLSTAGSPAWSLYAPPGTDPKIAAGSLRYAGLQAAPGDNSVVFDGVAPAAGISMRLLDQVYNISNVATIYYSLTFQVTSINAAGDWGGTATNFAGGSFMMGFNQKTSLALAQSDVAAPLLIRTGNPDDTPAGTANGFQQYQLGTGVTATTAIRAFDAAHNYNPGETLFLVLSYTFNPGASDDVAKLYVNPIPGSLENENTPVVTTTGSTDVNNSRAQSFFLRNNSVEPSGTQIDDLRIGTTWEDVTPELPPNSIDVVSGGGNITFTLRGTTGGTYLIEKSTSIEPLNSWIPDGEVILATPTQPVTRALAPGARRMFYRARRVPAG